MKEAQTINIIKIADTHVKHLQEALNDIQKNYPFDEQFVQNMNKNDLRILDTMTGRFAKLQDLLGNKIIDIYLHSREEQTLGLSMLDKIHKLEKLSILDNEEEWTELRDARNHIAHEYPDNPTLAAQHLNNVYRLAPKLINIYKKLIANAS